MNPKESEPSFDPADWPYYGPVDPGEDSIVGSFYSEGQYRRYLENSGLTNRLQERLKEQPSSVE